MPPAYELLLTPEEDAIGNPDDVDDEIDDLLPADLWFRSPKLTRHPISIASPSEGRR